MSFSGWQKVTIKTINGHVVGIAPIIISASRATDIPAFYPDWFMHRLKEGYVKWINRFNGQSKYVSFEKTRAIVFWTKNPEPFMRYLPELDNTGIHYYFTFTLNDYEAEKLEPNVPELKKRIDTFRTLSETIGRERVVWRFDPLILTKRLTVEGLLQKIHNVGKQIHHYTEKLVISFIDIGLYSRVRQNLMTAGFRDCKEFTLEDMTRAARGLQEMNEEWGLEIATCAETNDLSEYGIKHNKCIDNDLMIRVFGRDNDLMDFLGYVPPGDGFLPCFETKPKRTNILRDSGQRKDCGCIPSKDIGQYDTCVHCCVYCYANSSPWAAEQNYRKYKSRGKYYEAILSE
jgi:DNA repair photolyase